MAETSPVTAIARRMQEREIRRQLHANDARRTAIRLRAAVVERLPVLVREYAETLLGSLLGFAVLFELAAHLAGVSALYTLPAFGLVYAWQATYYKFKLASDPSFVIPSCRCAGRRRDGTADVLRSGHAAFLGVPSSLLAAAIFAALLALTAAGEPGPRLPLAGLALAASAYLGYAMLVRVRSVCTLCVNIAAINVLLVWQLAT